MFLSILTAIFFQILVSAQAAETNESLSTQLSWEEPPSLDQSTALESADSLKIFWWNIGCGHLNEKISKNEGQNPLYSNISNLAQSTMRPDLLILGEYCPSMPNATKKTLSQHYPHSYSLPKSNPYKGKNGIVIYSLFPIELISKKNLDVGLTTKESQDTTRTYLLLKVSAPNDTFYIAPLHFFNPWGKMGMAELLIKALGTDNPNYLQAEMHLDFLNEDVDIKTDKTLVLGDFNAAKNLFLYNSMAAYNLFTSSGLVDRSDNDSTFPSTTAVSYGNDYPGVHIDHTFSSTSFAGKTLMLPLRGSDHYPILFSY